MISGILWETAFDKEYITQMLNIAQSQVRAPIYTSHAWWSALIVYCWICHGVSKKNFFSNIAVLLIINIMPNITCEMKKIIILNTMKFLSVIHILCNIQWLFVSFSSFYFFSKEFNLWLTNPKANPTHKVVQSVYSQ